MADKPSQENKDKPTDQPSPEMLKPESGDASSSAGSSAALTAIKAKRAKRGTYRPSHKATFVGLGVVVLILVINVVIISLVVKSQGKSTTQANRGEVTLSAGVLNKLGVNRAGTGTAGTELTIGPDTQFNGTVQVASDVSIAGQLKLNSKLNASDASLAQLQAGKTSLDQLDVNGDGTVSNFSLRKDLAVAGQSRFQGPVTVNQLLTVTSNLNVSGNLAVGGTLSARTFDASSLVSDTTLTIGGHVITRGTAPGVSAGPAVGSNGTVSISGNDASGTVAANIGVGAGSGIVANVVFHSAYSGTPHVVVTAIGSGVGSVYVNRSANGFSIGVSGSMSPGGYAFDYIVMQ